MRGRIPRFAADAPFAERTKACNANGVPQLDPEHENSNAYDQRFPTKFPTHFWNERAALPEDRAYEDRFDQIDPIETSLTGIGLKGSQRDKKGEGERPHQSRRSSNASGN